MKLIRRYRVVLAALGALGFIGVSTAYYVTAHGFSAHDEPTFLEATVARQMRRMGVPRGQRTLINPVPSAPDVIKAGMEHFADHCAICHANDGSGNTAIGRNLYPKAPDMRTALTQNLSDAELFYIIENGIRLTGMPAWGTGTPDGGKASWTLVRFIRHLPQLTAEERARMEALNPRAPGEMMNMSEEDFLKGETPVPAPGHGTHKPDKR